MSHLVWIEQASLIFFLSNSHHVHLPLKYALSSHLFSPDHPISHCADLSQGHSLHLSYASLVYLMDKPKPAHHRAVLVAKVGSIFYYSHGKWIASLGVPRENHLGLAFLLQNSWSSVSALSFLGFLGIQDIQDPSPNISFPPSIPASFVLTETKQLLVLSQTQSVKAIHSLLLGRDCQHPQ